MAYDKRNKVGYKELNPALQSLIDSKTPLVDFWNHRDDDNRHICEGEREKWTKTYIAVNPIIGPDGKLIIANANHDGIMSIEEFNQLVDALKSSKYYPFTGSDAYNSDSGGGTFVSHLYSYPGVGAGNYTIQGLLQQLIRVAHHHTTEYSTPPSGGGGGGSAEAAGAGPPSHPRGP
jgi:hypothetical protein